MLFELPNEEITEKMRAKLAANRFMHHLGFQTTRVADGLVEGELPMQEAFRQQNGFAHGGIISTLCDTVAGFAAYTVAALPDQVVTAELKVSYYYPATGDTLYAKGWVEKRGRKVQFCESEVYGFHNGERRVFAKATATMMVLEPITN